MELSLFFSGFALSLSLCLDLGIVNTAIVREGIARGFWPSFLIGVGSSFGDLTYAVLATTGIALLLDSPPVRLTLWIGGTIALLYFAAVMLRSALRPQSPFGPERDATPGRAAPGGPPHDPPRDPPRRAALEPAHEPPARSAFRSFVWGWGIAIASPTAILWFATVGGSVVATSPARGAVALAFFLAGFFCASIAWSLGMAILSSVAGRKLGPPFVRAISALSALLFLYFAVDVFLEGLRTYV